MSSGTGSRTLKTTQRGEVAERYQRGETLLTIACALSCSPSTIRKELIRQGIPRRPVHGRGPLRLGGAS